jgi:hypothetical protein
VIGVNPLSAPSSKPSFFLGLLLYSFIYGTVFVNWIDLFVGPNRVPGYHLWLTFIYFAPFITVLLLYGAEDWELTLGFGLFTSLMNDLLYYVVGRYLFGIPVNLVEWYRCQLLPVCDKPIYFDFLFIRLKPYPYLMPLSIYSRIAAVYLLLSKWWRRVELRMHAVEDPPPGPDDIDWEEAMGWAGWAG